MGPACTDSGSLPRAVRRAATIGPVTAEPETLTYEMFGTASRELAEQLKDLPAPHHSQARGGTLQGGRTSAARSATRWT
jgi:hypothetical protein